MKPGNVAVRDDNVIEIDVDEDDDGNDEDDGNGAAASGTWCGMSA